MNGPQIMFKTTQVIRHDQQIDLPKCMYKIKNIHATTNGISSDHVVHGKKLDIIDQNQNLSGMAELEARQENILKNLAELKQLILQLRSNISNSPMSISTTVSANRSVEDLVKHPEIIINVNPDKPPFSLVAVQKLWGDFVHLKVETYLHSSVTSLPETSIKFAKTLESYKPSKNVPKISLRLIWKNVGIDAELLVSGAPIFGETNMLRYLARISPNQELNYEMALESHKIDSSLDISYLLSRATTKVARHNLLQALNVQLGKSQWLCGRNAISIADIAASSVIKQTTSANEISANLGKWLQRCEAVV